MPSTAPLFRLAAAFPAASRIRCTMHLCHAAPGKTSWIARLRPSWASPVTQMAPDTPRARSDRRNDFQPSYDSVSIASRPSRRR